MHRRSMSRLPVSRNWAPKRAIATLIIAALISSACCTQSRMPTGSRREPNTTEPVHVSGDIEIRYAIGRLRNSGRDSDAELEVLECRAHAWQRKVLVWDDQPAIKEFAEVSDSVTMAAAERRVESAVAIRTHPNDKATIKYQTYGQRLRGESPMTAKELTPCKENMAIGWYYIWSERQGARTSEDDNLYEILKPYQPVIIGEFDD